MKSAYPLLIPALLLSMGAGSLFAADAQETVESPWPSGGSDEASNSATRDTGPVDEYRHPLSANARVYIKNSTGSVAVRVWDKNELYYSARHGEAAMIEVSGSDSDLSVIVKQLKKAPTSGSYYRVGDTVDLRLMVPRQIHLELETVSADVAVDGLEGPLKVNAVSGDVALSTTSPEVSVQTVSGDVVLTAPSRMTIAKTVSGDLKLSGLGGELSAESISGDMQIQGTRFDMARLKTVSGDVRADISLADRARLSGESLSGDMTLAMPMSTSASIHAATFSGDIECAGSRSSEDSGNNRHRHSDECHLGSGDNARIDLSSFSGTLRVEQSAEPTP